MLVQQIMDFIHTLERESKPISCDVILCKALVSHFYEKAPNDSLSIDDIQFLENCYKNRWESIVDGDNDYTRNSSVINLHWIELARQLEPLAKVSYLKILIPTLKNDRDLNDFSLLTETVNMYNFFLGSSGTTLFRKWSFCEHLKTWQFTLSTYRSLTERKLNIVTIGELSRLKLCKHTEKQVTVGIEHFSNFWDFMRKKVFVHLNDNGPIPIAMLPHLLELIERYYYLKSNNLNFSIFKNEVNIFFRRLYSYPLAEVNSLYGAKIEYKDNEEYLLDVFIVLHSANDFLELDFEIQVLSKWLFQFNPTLKALSKELEPFYSEWPKGTLVKDINQIQSEALKNCCSLFVSLLTFHFKCSDFFGKQTHSFWDKTNDVFPEASRIFSILLPLIISNRPQAVAETYSEIIKDIITPAVEDHTWYTQLSRDEPTIKWLNCVHNNQLSEIGAYWFDPELLISALLVFNTHNQVVRLHINLFLDDLVHTYAQDQNDFMKQFRVNILFTQFLNGLSEHHRRNLLRLINICDIKTAKLQFLSNCVMHINERLSQLNQTPSEGSSIHFFPQMPKLDNSKFFELYEEVMDVNTIVTEYKSRLTTIKLEPKLLEKISSYLLKIGQPILSITQLEMVKNFPRQQDYIGQYN